MRNCNAGMSVAFSSGRIMKRIFSQCVTVLSELGIQCLSCFFISQNSKRVTSGCGDHGFGNQLCPESHYLQSNYSMWKACSYEYSSVLLAMLSIQGCFLFWHIVLRNGNFRSWTHSADPVPSSGFQYHQAKHSIDSYLKSCHSRFKVYALTYMCTAGLSMECLGGSWVSFLCCICHVQGERPWNPSSLLYQGLTHMMG